MRKIVYIILAICFISTLSFSSTDRPSAIAIEWWLRGQNKIDGAKINTKQLPDGKYEITHWEANGVSQPTNAQLEIIIDGYEQYLKDQEKFKKDSRLRVKAKLKDLGISQEDLDEIIK